MNGEQNSGKETGIAIAIVLLLALFLSGYLSFPGPGTTASQTASLGEVANRVAGTEENTAVSGENNQLVVTITNPGTGAEVKAGDSVSINYRAKFVDGREFDNSFQLNAPFVFTIGAGAVIQGVELGILGVGGENVGPMRVGESRTIFISPSLAYGEAGSPEGVVPPNTPLVFEVELLGIN